METVKVTRNVSVRRVIQLRVRPESAESKGATATDGRITQLISRSDGIPAQDLIQHDLQ